MGAGMNFDPHALSRFDGGDMTALNSLVTFSDGTQKPVSDCDHEDLKVMAAWAAYKTADAHRSLALMDAELDRRQRQNIKAVG